MRKNVRVTSCGTAPLAALALGLAAAMSAGAAQIDLPAPAGSVSFGTKVAVLPNGNFVVTDPDGPVSHIGAVYLYTPAGALISTLTGSSANDNVGSGGIVQVGAGNFVVLSPNWNSFRGAVTWVNGSTGLSGVVSSANSLAGAGANDQIGVFVTALSNGNYVVASPYWNGAQGAATWGSGGSGVSGAVSASNSLVGSTGNDLVAVAAAVALTNGNYVVPSKYWNNGTPNSHIGATTWGNGTSGTSGVVSTGNSLTGSNSGDMVGGSITVLTNGNYVVGSPNWRNGAAQNAGAATWMDGTAAHAAAVGAGNSLVGTVTSDQVSVGGVAALSNGNYVVASQAWSNGVGGGYYGAATWGSGTSGISGPVSAANSLIGSSVGDQVAVNITALTNGKYVVGSNMWQNGSTIGAGAATLLDGSAAFSGTVTPSNSLVGTANNDRVSASITALSDGNYVVSSGNWNNGVAGNYVGAVTWGSGTSGISGPLLASESLYGTTGSDFVGAGIALALRNGNYLALSHYWNNAVASGQYGAVTWSRAGGGTRGAVSAANSLIGSFANDKVGNAGGRVFSDGNYAIFSPNGVNNHGAVTLGNGAFRLKGTIAPWNSVIGSVPAPALPMSYDYDATRHRLVVGRPSDNIVSLFTMDQIFADDFDP